MPITAATLAQLAATQGSDLGGLVGIGLLALALATVGYLALCWVKPITRCRKRNAVPCRVYCRRCNSTGYRVRAGRRVLNRIRDSRRRDHWS